jgi:hypothetical protein
MVGLASSYSGNGRKGKRSNLRLIEVIQRIRRRVCSPRERRYNEPDRFEWL